MKFDQKLKNKNFKVDKNVAYFIGVLHSDGCIYRFKDKKKDLVVIRLNLNIAHKSLLMAQKFKKILLLYFNRTVNIRKVPNKNLYAIQTSINRIYYIFKNWENSKIPDEIKNDASLFGAYLAGLIDGDGHVKIKNNVDRIVPQCVIKISSNRPLKEIKVLMGTYANCKVHFEYEKRSNGVLILVFMYQRKI